MKLRRRVIDQIYKEFINRSVIDQVEVIQHENARRVAQGEDVINQETDQLRQARVRIWQMAEQVEHRFPQMGMRLTEGHDHQGQKDDWVIVCAVKGYPGNLMLRISTGQGSSQGTFAGASRSRNQHQSVSQYGFPKLVQQPGSFHYMVGQQRGIQPCLRKRSFRMFQQRVFIKHDRINLDPFEAAVMLHLAH